MRSSCAFWMRPVCIVYSTRTNKVEEAGRTIETDHDLRMGKLNFDIDEASLLKTYGLSTLAPAYVTFGVWEFAVTE